MVRVLVVCLFCPLLNAQGVRIVVGRDATRQIVRGFSSGGEVSISAVSVPVELHDSRGSGDPALVLVFYDPKSHCYAWRMVTKDSPATIETILALFASRRMALYSEDKRLVVFNGLAALERSDRVTTIEDAVSASIVEISKGLARFQANGFDPGYKAIDLGHSIPRGFACPDPPVSAICNNPSRFISITRRHDGWVIVLRNQWDQEVVLDSEFKLVGTRRIAGR